MNLKDLSQLFISKLSHLYDEGEVRSVFDLLTGQLTGYSKAESIMKSGEPVSAKLLDEYMLALPKLVAGMPVQYVLGGTTFFGFPFMVSPDVLIPRPETEELVSWIIETCAGSRQESQIADLGTGSGCIAISLKKHFTNAVVSAFDISKPALAVARHNALINSAEVDFFEADLLNMEVAGKYDIIVSNPPYISEAERDNMHSNVLDFEPHLALFVSNERPLIFYEAIADFALSNLRRKGFLFFEINSQYGLETKEMLENKGFEDVILRKDIHGNDRMIKASVADDTAQ